MRRDVFCRMAGSKLGGSSWHTQVRVGVAHVEEAAEGGGGG